MRKILVLCLGLVALSSAAASAATITFTGTTVGGPVWNRPVAGNPPTPPLSGVGTAVPYSAQAFVVDQAGVYSVLSDAVAPANWDNYTFLYTNPFMPSSPFTNIIIGDDDEPTIGLSGFTTNLTAGTTYILVTTGFGNADAGTFSNTISGPGNIRLTDVPSVPEPVSMVLLGTGLIGMALRRRRQ